MFCDELIKEIYIGVKEKDDVYDHHAFLDCYHDLTYYCTEGYRLVFVTDNYSISLSANGVIKESKEDLHEGEGEWLQNAVADVGDAYVFVHYTTVTCLILIRNELLA